MLSHDRHCVQEKLIEEILGFIFLRLGPQHSGQSRGLADDEDLRYRQFGPFRFLPQLSHCFAGLFFIIFFQICINETPTIYSRCGVFQ
jgi:hypothetical protein